MKNIKLIVLLSAATIAPFANAMSPQRQPKYTAQEKSASTIVQNINNFIVDLGSDLFKAPIDQKETNWETIVNNAKKLISQISLNKTQNETLWGTNGLQVFMEQSSYVFNAIKDGYKYFRTGGGMNQTQHDQLVKILTTASRKCSAAQNSLKQSKVFTAADTQAARDLVVALLATIADISDAAKTQIESKFGGALAKAQEKIPASPAFGKKKPTASPTLAKKQAPSPAFAPQKKPASTGFIVRKKK